MLLPFRFSLFIDALILYVVVAYSEELTQVEVIWEPVTEKDILM
jgi:hypothetical protein